MNRENIIRRCRAKFATRSFHPPTEAELDHGVTMFLDQPADALRRHLISSPDIARSAVQHGHELLLQGFTVSQVVHDYLEVCQAITELAVEMNAPISTDDFRMLNRRLDDAIAGAATEFGREQNQSTLNGETARGNERAGFLAHEMRNLLNTAIVAFEVLKTGNVGVGGAKTWPAMQVERLNLNRGGTLLDCAHRMIVSISIVPARLASKKEDDAASHYRPHAKPHWDVDRLLVRY